MSIRCIIKFSQSIIILNFLILGLGHSSWGQDIDVLNNDLPLILPPSPDAISLGKYGLHPVSYYSGLPEIVIPLYSIELDGFSLPITLSYHASGIKVEEEASWVGLGWALNAGGLITKSIMGLDDDEDRTDKEIPIRILPIRLPDIVNVMGDRANCDSVKLKDDSTAGGYSEDLYFKDFEPDVYYYNFSGHSGSFILNEEDKPILSKDYKINIERKNGWTVTTDDGTEFLFSDTEQTENRMRLSSGEYPNEADYNYSNYLSRITTARGDTIKFEYDIVDSLRVETLDKLSTTTYELIDETVNCHIEGSSMTIREYIRKLYLKKISFNNGFILFERFQKSREDLKNAQALSMISIYRRHSNGSFILFKDINLSYGYFNNSKDDNEYRWKRLRLDNIRIKNSDGDLHPPFVFSYNPKDLPMKSSIYTDHWGYYSSWSMGGHVRTSYENKFYSGSYKETHPTDVMAGMLMKIQYPTGGYTKFEYESHDYPSAVPLALMNDEYETKMAVIERNNYCEDLCEEPEQRQESDLFLIEGEEEFTQVSLEYELSCQSCEIRPPCHDKYNYQPNQEINNVYASMVEVDPITEEILNYVAHFKYRIDWSSFKPTKGNVDVGVHPGRHYKLITYAKEGHCSDVRINAKWKNTSIFTNELGGYNYTKLAGGVRIKKITDNDGNKDTRSRSFRYGYFDAENNYHSYGQLHVPYLYTKLFLGREFVFEMASETFDPCDLDNQLVCWQLMRMTRSQYPMSISPSGSTVGYTKVEINENDSQESGKTIHEYINWPTYFPEPDEEEPFHPYFKEVIPSSSNGLLNRVTIYQFDIDKYIKVKETVFKYIQLVNDWYPGLKIFKYNPCRSYAAFCFFDMYFSYSAMNSSLFRQSSITENIYVNNISAFSTKKEFQYENSPKHYQIVQEKELKSDGSIFTTNYKYPLDFTEDYLGSNLLKENHIHNKPIEIESNLYRNDSTVNLLRKNVLYSGFGKYVLPSRVVHYYENNVDRKSIVNYKYSQATGKLLSMQKDSDKVLSFIFGYDNQYPITQIENAAYSEVEAALGSEFILEGPGGNTLSTNQINSLKTALPNALVTTYTYEPLIGMTSQTDPNGRTTVYEYDGFGRLKAVKQQGASDPEAEMVKTYEYNYQK